MSPGPLTTSYRGGSASRTAVSSITAAVSTASLRPSATATTVRGPRVCLAPASASRSAAMARSPSIPANSSLFPSTRTAPSRSASAPASRETAAPTLPMALAAAYAARSTTVHEFGRVDHGPPRRRRRAADCRRPAERRDHRCGARTRAVERSQRTIEKIEPSRAREGRGRLFAR
jgi:hypothetical protein